MSRQVSELETLLRQMIQEHTRLLELMTRHEAAMKTFDLRTIDDAGREQDALRLKIAGLDQRRKLLVKQIVGPNAGPGEVTLRRLAALHPDHSESLLRLREQLKALVQQIGVRSKVSGRVAGAVLGHLNTVVRLLAGVVERAGLYTRNGVPRVSSRIGALEAVG